LRSVPLRGSVWVCLACQSIDVKHLPTRYRVVVLTSWVRFPLIAKVADAQNLELET